MLASFASVRWPVCPGSRLEPGASLIRTGTSVLDLVPRNVNTLYRAVRLQTFPHDIERLFEVTVLIAQRSIRKITAFRFWIHKDLVFGQVVLQRELIFFRGQNIRMLVRRQALS